MTAYQKYVTRMSGSATGLKSSGDYGATRGQWLNKTATWINRKLPNSLSYFDCLIDGQPRKCGIVTQNNTDQKRIMSMPGETLTCGSYVEWMDQIWIIFQVEAPYELYQAGIMRQCNYLLKWINDRGELVERWVYAEDGTKYMTGEYVQSMMTVGDARYQITMPRDEQTIRIMRGDRFIIDDPDALDPLAFKVTKPNRVSYTYMQEKGVFITMMQECNLEPDDDNLDLMIANYYSRIGKVNIVINNMSDITSMIVGSELQIDADVSVGGSKQSNPDLVYTSSDETIATVSEDGLIVALAEGECTITVSYAAQSVDISLSVVSEDEHVSETMLVIRPLNDQTSIYCGMAAMISLSTVCDGVQLEDTEYECSIDCDSAIATLSVAENIATITTSDNRKYLGTAITLTATDVINDVSASLEFKIRGWS